ncbi:hypothetical protein DV515_00013131 [Chloebia gouldiae]|uniref:Uncharacterized protein n=1 Tax=Chloebia gouldiae TaxID=44316 RepID=A0A3L8S342_CHLGU|nr:hypothetical protein DV515_00013131 [Chloebia gouldiae]
MCKARNSDAEPAAALKAALLAWKRAEDTVPPRELDAAGSHLPATGIPRRPPGPAASRRGSVPALHPCSDQQPRLTAVRLLGTVPSRACHPGSAQPPSGYRDLPVPQNTRVPPGCVCRGRPRGAPGGAGAGPALPVPPCPVPSRLLRPGPAPLRPVPARHGTARHGSAQVSAPPPGTARIGPDRTDGAGTTGASGDPGPDAMVTHPPYVVSLLGAEHCR